MVGFVGVADMGGVPVGVGVDGDGFNAQFMTGANNPQGNFPAIRHQQFLKSFGVEFVCAFHDI
jgi:hypothetical protein